MKDNKQSRDKSKIKICFPQLQLRCLNTLRTGEADLRF